MFSEFFCVRVIQKKKKKKRIKIKYIFSIFLKDREEFLKIEPNGSKFRYLKALDIKAAANSNVGNARIYLITMIYLSYNTGK